MSELLDPNTLGVLVGIYGAMKTIEKSVERFLDNRAEKKKLTAEGAPIVTLSEVRAEVDRVGANMLAAIADMKLTMSKVVDQTVSQGQQLAVHGQQIVAITDRLTKLENRTRKPFKG